MISTMQQSCPVAQVLERGFEEGHRCMQWWCSARRPPLHCTLESMMSCPANARLRKRLLEAPSACAGAASQQKLHVHRKDTRTCCHRDGGAWHDVNILRRAIYRVRSGGQTQCARKAKLCRFMNWNKRLESTSTPAATRWWRSVRWRSPPGCSAAAPPTHHRATAALPHAPLPSHT